LIGGNERFIVFYTDAFHNSGLYIAHPFKRELQISAQFWQKYGIMDREKDITYILIAGHNNVYIGEKLFISAKTVKNHVYNIYQKNSVKNRIELMYKL
jgi:DNA-binding NarL/FixJ family response regulator